MACFLIDYENQSDTILSGISLLGLNKNDEILFFYGKNTARISFMLLKELEKTPAKKLYIKTETGTPNSLDFQLSSYLGACIQKNPGKQYYIVSKDHGYDCVCRFWCDKNIFVKRIDHLSYFLI